MRILDRALWAYSALKDHFDRFVSQLCYTDVDGLESWCIQTKDKRCLLLVKASDGCTYLLRGSYLGDLHEMVKEDLSSEVNEMVHSLSKCLSSHKVLKSHFRVQALESMLLLFTGSRVLDPPVAMEMEKLRNLPLAHIFAQCLQLQRSFEAFATQLTGECINLERLRHIYIPEMTCSTYIHHTVDTETPFSYIILKGSQISPTQASAPSRTRRNGLHKDKDMDKRLSDAQTKASEREVCLLLRDEFDVLTLWCDVANLWWHFRVLFFLEPRGTSLGALTTET